MTWFGHSPGCARFPHPPDHVAVRHSEVPLQSAVAVTGTGELYSVTSSTAQHSRSGHSADGHGSGQHWQLRPRVSVIVPALNEAENLHHVLPMLAVQGYEVLLVAGHSTDDTVEVARTLLPDVVIVEQPGNGKGDAVVAGLAAARGDFIVILDADGSTNPAHIPRFVDALENGCDVAKGTRAGVGGGSEDF